MELAHISGRKFPSSKTKKKTLFKPKLKKKTSLKKFLYFLISWKVELSDSEIKKFLIFSQKKAFLIFRETKTWKKFFTFHKVTFRA